jgi:hypothetical protein
MNYVSSIPTVHITMEAGIRKHASHIGDITDVPIVDITIEESGSIKHITHIGDSTNIPIVDIPIE